jgi:dolichol-phosphate mannosyltransferase
LEVRQEKSGLGTAYIHGFKWAIGKKYDYIFEMDADFSHNPTDLLRLLKACEKGADVSVGSRYKKGVNVVNWPLYRILLSYGASFYVKMITGMRVHDPTAGFVCYKRYVLENIDLDSVRFVGYAFQIEMKFRAYLKNYKIEEVSIIFKDRVKGKSKMSSSIISEAIWGVFVMKLRSLFQKNRF